VSDPLESRLTLLIAGAWLAALVFSWWVATNSFRVVDRVLGPESRPELQERLSPLSPTARREAFRHLASEINRALFAGFGAAQLIASVALVLLAWRPGGTVRVLAVAAFWVVLIQLLLGWAITSHGRAIDFVPRPLPADVGRRFGMLHGAFVLLDLAKAGALFALTTLLARR
jgi:hypothetical protein